MPRLSPSSLLRARRTSPLLPLLLRECRSWQSAKNELRWIKEAAEEKFPDDKKILLDMCVARGRGIPLQYILGSQPFGDLDILCQRGVLIPRPETEAYTAYLADLLLQNKEFENLVGQKFRVLDLCTGTGCISLYLHSLLSKSFPEIEIRGVDISPIALSLAEKNRSHNIRSQALSDAAASQVTFQYSDVLKGVRDLGMWDVVISNPPYISSLGYNKETARSVRNWEPRLALVPPPIKDSGGVNPADIFYPRILDAARGAKVVVTEVADLYQAKRVSALALEMRIWRVVEIWRDWPDGIAEDGEESECMINGQQVILRGTGNGRSVVCWS